MIRLNKYHVYTVGHAYNEILGTLKFISLYPYFFISKHHEYKEISLYWFGYNEFLL